MSLSARNGIVRLLSGCSGIIIFLLTVGFLSNLSKLGDSSLILGTIVLGLVLAYMGYCMAFHGFSFVLIPQIRNIAFRDDYETHGGISTHTTSYIKSGDPELDKYIDNYFSIRQTALIGWSALGVSLIGFIAIWGGWKLLVLILLLIFIISLFWTTSR